MFLQKGHLFLNSCCLYHTNCGGMFSSLSETISSRHKSLPCGCSLLSAQLLFSSSKGFESQVLKAWTTTLFTKISEQKKIKIAYSATPDMTDVVGEFVEMPGEFCGEWRIPDFLSYSEDKDSTYRSEAFFFAGACWNLEIHPNDETQHNFEGWIGLYVIRMDTGPPITLSYALRVKKSDGGEEIVFKRDCRPFLNEDRGWGTGKFLKWSDLLGRKPDLLPSGVLTVTCSLKNKPQSSMPVSLCRRLWNMSLSLQGLLSSQEKTDVTFMLGDGEVRAHRVILETRSDVFQRMFATEMRESQTGEVSVEEVDKSSFDVALAYVYSGEPAGLSSKNASAVYRIAHKYDLRELVGLCANYMQECLSVDTACDVIAVAEVYREAALKGRAMDFFLVNAAEIVRTDHWKTLKVENLALVSELLESIVVSNAGKLKTANCSPNAAKT